MHLSIDLKIWNIICKVNLCGTHHLKSYRIHCIVAVKNYGYFAVFLCFRERLIFANYWFKKTSSFFFCFEFSIPSVEKKNKVQCMWFPDRILVQVSRHFTMFPNSICQRCKSLNSNESYFCISLKSWSRNEACGHS